MDNKSCNDFIKNVEDIAKKIGDGGKFVNPEYINDFSEKVRRAKEHAEDIVKTNRSLKIGIVGQVKAGKSSFLNALIFDGKDILPKAATPMTAALTKISYSENPGAKVVFYTKKDWEVIEDNSRHFDEEFQRLERNLRQRRRSMDLDIGEVQLTQNEIQNIENQIPATYKSCKELTTMAENSFGILSKLGKEESISVLNLQTDLEQYVGADGKYTPIVKWIELEVNNALLKDIEIIDTPGLGDPIMSRSEKTKEFLMACDLVFVLSPAPQFMSKEDIALIVETLPGESINHAVLVGSKFDSAMLDDSSRGRLNLISVLKVTAKKLNNSAQKVITASRVSEKGNVHSLVLKRIEEETRRQISEEGSLYYISSILYNASRRMSAGEDLDEMEAHILSQMLYRFEGMKTDPEFLRELAGIDNLRDKEFKKIRKEKENIIAERSREFVKDQILSFTEQINTIQMEAEQMLRLTETSDFAALQKKLETSQNALISMRRDIQNEFERCAIDTRKYIVDIAQQVKSRAEEHTDIFISEGQDTQTRYREESFLIFFTEKVPYEVTVFYKTANISDVITNLQKYIVNAEKNIAEGLRMAVNTNEIRNRIKNVVLRAFQKADAEFDENDILGPVELVLSKLTVPDFSVVNAQKYGNMILSEFPSTQVMNEEIATLELRQTQVLYEIANDITVAMEKKSDEIAKELKEQALHFTDDVKKSIENRIQRLQKNLQDKEGSIQNYKNFLSRVADCKENLRNLNSKG